VGADPPRNRGRPLSLGNWGSAKKIACLRDEIRELTDRRWLWAAVEDRVVRLNRLLRGWSNYFCLGPVSPAYRAIDRHGRHRLRQWLCAKHKARTRGTSRFPDQYLYDELGLIRLRARTKSFPWAKAGVLVREPGARKSPAGFDERGVETEHGEAIEAPATERAGNS
jgi:hypothetical protein